MVTVRVAFNCPGEIVLVTFNSERFIHPKIKEKMLVVGKLLHLAVFFS